MKQPWTPRRGMGRWGDGDPPLTPPRRGMGRWGDGRPACTQVDGLAVGHATGTEI
ncbi:hypothetical protein [Moorena sp. SIO3I8]|uniref:hypothetical protein n=1 Tax=Moorena sp. SIO3I8 TaxID=2607833 RepID=UPI0013C03212|nr:hypothetical protein [Moorena sp. SIO3I8]NEO08979.1 hypothetical protein [Moorena sp. SIO3I8]